MASNEMATGVSSLSPDTFPLAPKPGLETLLFAVAFANLRRYFDFMYGRFSGVSRNRRSLDRSLVS